MSISSPNGHAPLILIVDDIPENIQILHQILIRDNYSFAIASSGAETFSVLEKKMPDLILLDVMMDDMDGFEVCRRLKENPKAAEIPVIFLTARVRLEDKVKGFRAGAVDYITKPFEEDEVVARVRTHVQLKRAGDTMKRYAQELEGKNNLITKQNEELEENYRNLSRRQEEIIALERHNAMMRLAITTNHELNQPLTVIQGYLDMLLKSLPPGSLQEHQMKYLQRIESSFDKMLKIMERFRKSPLSLLDEHQTGGASGDA